MDVFQITDSVNANVPPSPHNATPIIPTVAPTANNCDVINANAPVTNNVTPVVAPAAPVVVQNSVNDKAAVKVESNNVNVAPVKSAPEVKTTQNKWDVTNVFNKGRLAEPTPYVPSVTDNNNDDETDRAVISNDRPAKAANEAAAHVPTQVVDKKCELPYKEGEFLPE